MIYEGKPFVSSYAVSLEYKRKLRKLCDDMISATVFALSGTFNGRTFISPKDINYQKDILDNLKSRFEYQFSTEGYEYAKRMIFNQTKSSIHQMRSMIADINKNTEILIGGKNSNDFPYELLDIGGTLTTYSVSEENSATMMENEALLDSIPSTYFDRLAGVIARGVNSGGRIPILKKEIQKLNNKTRLRAENIATDQSRKAFQAVNVANMKKVGIKRFKWVHNYLGNEPRIHHKNNFPNGLNGGIFDIDNPPIIEPKSGIRGFPGQLPFCQCTMAPVI